MSQPLNMLQSYSARKVALECVRSAFSLKLLLSRVAQLDRIANTTMKTWGKTKHFE